MARTFFSAREISLHGCDRPEEMQAAKRREEEKEEEKDVKVMPFQAKGGNLVRVQVTGGTGPGRRRGDRLIDIIRACMPIPSWEN